MLNCGLFAVESNKPIPLSAIHYDVDVKGFAGSITINQTFQNVESTDHLECVYGFPMNDQAAVTGFTVKIDDRTLISQYKKKDEAFKEYNAALQRGDGAYLLDQADRSDDTFVLSVGRLPPGKECVVSINYVCTLDSVSETKQRLLIPMALFPRYNPNPAGVLDLTAAPEKYAATVSYKATLDAKIETLDKVKSVSSVSHPIAVSIIEHKSVKVTFGAQQQPVDRDLVIDIEIQNNPQHYVFVERVDGDQFVGMYSFVPQLETDSQKVLSELELVFVVDCSGSMEGDKIEDAKRAMQIFLRSIPEGCYFNFYRFGSTFESLFPESKLYSELTFKAAKSYADATAANLGGTEILQPLHKIFATPALSGFSRQLFILTDGEVSNTEQVIDLVKKNASDSRVFSFGIGDSCSRSLVNGIALAGNGKSEYCKHGEILEDKIGRHLERALQPAVVQASVLWEGVKNVQQVPYVLPPVFRGDRQIAYAFFEVGETEQSPKVILQLKDQVAEQTPFKYPVNESSPGIQKLAARALIKFLETAPSGSYLAANGGSLQRRNNDPIQMMQEAASDPNNKKKITEISLKYGVMCKYVSLLAVEQRVSGIAKEMQLREVPVQMSASRSQFGLGYKATPTSVFQGYQQSQQAIGGWFRNSAPVQFGQALSQSGGPPLFGSVYGSSGSYISTPCSSGNFGAQPFSSFGGMTFGSSGNHPTFGRSMASATAGTQLFGNSGAQSLFGSSTSASTTANTAGFSFGNAGTWTHYSAPFAHELSKDSAAAIDILSELQNSATPSATSFGSAGVQYENSGAQTDFGSHQPAQQQQQYSDMERTGDVEMFDATLCHKPVLNQVLDLQQWNGTWEFSMHLERILGVTQDSAANNAGEMLDVVVLATLLVVAYLNAKHAGQVHIWQAIANKALTFVRKHISAEKEAVVLKNLQNLF
ncbi:von Willebrand factor A domain-containing protein 5A-like [Paramacrobiotus metropolitanus]|uniref:von Willebrand factor A domain-containing protein 5A-like n=1 Tax=Paramacrobiotus metropolitanus TaxID=2943436 RepID=UPI002446172B|nr:von Willebrand factor A domain-containing protein 5A-like [Paramacrobiotus metropolitanus]XP_055343977.1 von Willebrand factor A domain-containing protein 5A-like [Paramacrobiotus metropolitanus]